MNILLGLILGVISLQPSFENKTVDQALFYINEISKEKNLSENYWALNELYQSTCSVNNSVIRIIINSDNNKAKNYFARVTCGETESEQIKNKNERLRIISLEEKLAGLGVYYLYK
ncbi:MAG: hypothetical protein ACMZ7B_13185 [Balneola sp.]